MIFVWLGACFEVEWLSSRRFGLEAIRTYVASMSDCCTILLFLHDFHLVRVQFIRAAERCDKTVHFLTAILQ